MPTALLQQNPPLQRFEYVAKTYGEKHPDVVLDTFFSLADTVGIENPAREFDAVRRWDNLRAGILREARQEGRPGLPTESSRNRQQREILRQLLEELQDDPRMKRGREVDALWPWLARELVRVKKTGTLMTDRTPAWMGWSKEVDGKGSAIALWQQQNRIDLGQWRIPAVLEALESFRLEQRGEIPQGKIVYQFDDGWTVQRLVDPEQLGAEGEVMQHCVGEYCPQVAAGETIIYSLRDPKGRPHVTMETREGFGRFLQVQGKQNRKPIEEYLERVKQFAVEKGINPSAELTSEEYDRAFGYGSERGKEAWEANSQGSSFAISLASEGYDGDVIDVYDILDNTKIKGAPEDWADSELGPDLEEAALDGANTGWDEALGLVREGLDEIVGDVAAAAEEELDEGEDPDSIDLDYAVQMALESSTLPWGHADLSYAAEEAVSRVGRQ